MKFSVTGLFLTLVTLVTCPATGIAGTLAIDINGVLGPVLLGTDPIGLAGATFAATGAIDPNAAAISSSGGADTYALSEELQIMVGTLALTGYNGMLTITAPPSGPDTLALSFSVTEFGFTPLVGAYLTLPPDTLSGTEIQSFWANVGQPDSSLWYSVPGEEYNISGALGITGSASIGGNPPAGAPEPGTVSLLATGLVLAIAMKMKLPGRWGPRFVAPQRAGRKPRAG